MTGEQSPNLGLDGVRQQRSDAAQRLLGQGAQVNKCRRRIELHMPLEHRRDAGSFVNDERLAPGDRHYGSPRP